MRNIILLLALVVSISSISGIVYAQEIAKHNPDDVCKTAKNIQNITQKITYCIDSDTKKKYIPQEAPILSTEGIFSASTGNASDFVFVGNASSSLSNMNLTSFLGAKATHLLPIDAGQVCRVNGDKKCESIQNQFITQNITTTKNSAGNWQITGGLTYIGINPVTKLGVTANFYDSKGMPIAGFVSQDLQPIQPGDTVTFKLDTVKTGTKAIPAFVSISYHGEQTH